jgi:peptidoglycan/LPS O-acetylase OafA/YrhL
MNRGFSIYLDLVRFIAACLVYVYHSNQRLLVADVLPASRYGHSAVIVFFVLSGYVIAHVTATKEREWVSYAASRISRIYSVALPAVLLTIVLDAAGHRLYPALYDYPFDAIAVRAAASLLLMNEWWFVSITSFSNVPYWSICYESWYYIAFAIAVFAPARVAWVLVPALALLLGPKIVLLAPLWAAGVLLYRWQRLRDIGPATAWALVVASTAGIVAFHAADVQAAGSAWLKSLVGAKWQAQLTFSQFFATDYLLGALVFLNFAGMRVVACHLEPAFTAIARPVRFLAGYTLTLYLLHQPLFLFWGAVLHGDPKGLGNWVAVTALTAGSVLVVGYFTESRRHHLRAWVEQGLRRLQAALASRGYAVGH